MDPKASAVPVPPWRTPRKAREARRPLSQDLIVEAGLRVLDAEGLEALSMRKVAHELGTGPASLYAHVTGRDELLELIYDQVIGVVELPEPDPERWLEQLRRVAVDTFRVLSAHSDIAKVSLANIPTGPNALRIAETQLAIMITGGVPPQIAGWMVDRIGLYISADAYEGSLHLARRRAAGKDLGEYLNGFFGQLADFYRSLPPERFPMLVRHVDELMAGGGVERFEFGLDLLLNGLAGFVVKPPEE
jgi:AcrR family transcriptional regulator